jgi:VanZ family protein
MSTFCQGTLRLLVFYAWATTILVLSLVPDPPHLSSEVLGWDKFQHAAAFALFAVFAGGVMLIRCRRAGTAWLLAFAAALLYGAFIEIAQMALTSFRRAEWADLLADALGAALASGAGFLTTMLRARFPET